MNTCPHCEGTLINPMISSYIFDVIPMGKPRMTRGDQFRVKGHHEPKKRMRSVVERYWAYKHELQILAKVLRFQIPESNYRLVFFIPMPESWSAKKKAEMFGKPHQATPDKDNLEKGFLDALCENDAYIWDGRVTKFWSDKGKIRVEIGGV